MRWFTLLGPVRAGLAGSEVDLGAAQQKSVLATLLLHAGQHVSLNQMVDWVWGDHPPRSAAQIIRTYVYRLRRALTDPRGTPGARIESVGTGYVMHVEPDELDLAVFRRHVTEAEAARRADDLAGARAILAEGLARWGGEPFADLSGDRIDAARARLGKLRLSALEQAIELDVELGRYSEAVDAVSALVAANPLDERFRRLLMLALARSGQRSEALAVYAGTRAILAEELGIDPGPELRDLHLRILRADDAAEPPAEWHGPATPAQLPARLAGFIGRKAELDRLDTLLADSRLVCLHGMAGTGKTALAVQWAHGAADRFPDGQLYLNLRGFDPSGQVMETGEALATLLGALGLPSGRIPAAIAGRTALLRTLLAGRRMLLLLDNAHSAEQVRPLLPGTCDCVVVVTSRDQLPGLVAFEHAQPVRLDPLPAAEARAFLAARIGGGRVADDDAVAEIAWRCGRLPLALTILAARAVLQPEVPLSALLGQLRAHHGTLTAFQDSDDALDARSVFSWSYRSLTPDAARLFRLLAVHPGDDFSLASAASIAGVAILDGRRLLTELVRANLVREHFPGRYTRHDLLRAYAADLLAETSAVGGKDSERMFASRQVPGETTERTFALRRLLDHYLHSARATIPLLGYNFRTADGSEIGADVTREPLPGRLDAEAWLARERHSLVTSVRLAADSGEDSRAWQLADAVSHQFQRRGHWREQVAVQRVALDAARRLGDRRAEGLALRSLGSVYGRCGRVPQAVESLTAALAAFEECGDLYNLARTHGTLAYLHDANGDYAASLACGRATYRLMREIDDAPGAAMALCGVGWAHAALGAYGAAIIASRQALDDLDLLGLSDGRASALEALGWAYAGSGCHRQAITHYLAAIKVCEEFDERLGATTILDRLGESQLALADRAGARDSWERAARTLETLRHPRAERARQRLAALDR
jgi:DNA-binding SARP family transcriptional activator